MQSGKLSSNLQLGMASVCKELKYFVRLRREVSVSKRESFKKAH